MVRIAALVLMFFAILGKDTQAQYAYKNGKTELVRRNGFMKLSGWNFALGPTWMAGRLRNTRDELFRNSGGQQYVATFDPAGRIGLYAEVGRHKIFEYGWLFPYMDYGIAYKSLRGKENWEAEYENVDGSTTPVMEMDVTPTTISLPT